MSLLHVLWNLFLAFLPVALGWGVAGLLSRKHAGWLWIPLALAWFFFLPNTSYLLTGWRHFFSIVEQHDLFVEAREAKVALLRFLFVSGCFLIYTGMGIATFALAVRPVERVARMRGVPVNWIAAPFFLLVAHGVYLGLVLRFDSWDLVTRPEIVLHASREAVTRPELTALTAGFALFLWLSYLGADVWIDGLLQRMGRRDEGTKR